MAKVVIVDENDNVVGALEKQEAIEKGLIRRISRVILYNDRAELLLQQRGRNKKLNPWKWDFSATGHVDEGEDYEDAAHRELKEELGLENVGLEKADYFFVDDEPAPNSKVKLPKFNTVYLGKYSGKPITVDAEEVEKIEWVSFDEISRRFKEAPAEFTTSFAVTLEHLGEKLSTLK